MEIDPGDDEVVLALTFEKPVTADDMAKRFERMAQRLRGDDD